MQEDKNLWLFFVNVSETDIINDSHVTAEIKWQKLIFNWQNDIKIECQSLNARNLSRQLLNLNVNWVSR